MSPSPRDVSTNWLCGVFEAIAGVVACEATFMTIWCSLTRAALRCEGPLLYQIQLLLAKRMNQCTQLGSQCASIASYPSPPFDRRICTGSIQV